MRVEDPAAYKYLFNDDVFLLDAEKQLFNGELTVVIHQDAIQQIETAPEVIVPVAASVPKTVQYLGQNKKALLVLTSYADAEFIAPDHQAALEATLKRKDYTIDDIAIVNLGKYPDAALAELLTQLVPQKIMVLGKAAAPKELSATAFNQVAAYNNLPVLITFAFGEMMSSNENKKAFWEQVKNF